MSQRALQHRQWIIRRPETRYPPEPDDLSEREVANTLALHERPKTRLDCLPGGPNEQRPCPWLSCKYHLGLEVSEAGTLYVNPEWDDGRPTCSLDLVARNGKHTLEEVAMVFDLTRERVRQIEDRVQPRLRRKLERAGIKAEHVFEDPPPGEGRWRTER